jgi:hypothetical protein
LAGHWTANASERPGAACKVEFDAFLECGILAHGFLLLRCGDCGHDKLLAFSCKRRGFCLSCGARRMAQSAAQSTLNRSPTALSPLQRPTHSHRVPCSR